MAIRRAVPVLTLTLLFPAAGADFSSYAFVQDDATLRIDNKTVRLYGVYIPTTDQNCRTWERPVKCAPRAALALDFKVQQSFVHCQEKGREPDGTIIGLCRVGRGSFSEGEDLSAYLLEQGWALALPDAPFEYHAIEKITRNRGIGVWGIPVDRLRRAPPRGDR
jgi:endonuclease YncB( thermonuclease family)